MTLYRLAIQDRQTAAWIWKTTAVSSLQAVIQLLKSFRAFPQDCILVFVATSKEALNEMLRHENARLVSGSVTATQFLRERLLHVPGQRAVEKDATKPVKQPVKQPAMAFATVSPRSKQSTVTDWLDFSNRDPLERKRMVIECGPGGDHDSSYIFSLPISMPQLFAWTRLQSRVRAGELEP